VPAREIFAVEERNPLRLALAGKGKQTKKPKE
jgi:hypothetical protein